MDRHHANSRATRDAIRTDGDHVLLAFSCGKDSIAAWLALRAEGFKVTPVYKYLVPGLAFVDRSLAYYEDWFETPIVRVAHASLYRWLRQSTFQAPERVTWVDEIVTMEPSYEDGWIVGAQKAGVSETLWVANGVRACDSPLRRVALTKHGSITPRTRSFMAIWDWTKKQVMDEIKSAGVRLPVDYLMWGRSFDGLDARFLVPLAKTYPEDYRRILEWFPLAELEVKRHEWRAVRERSEG